MKIIKFQSYQSSVAKQADRNRILIVISWFLFDLCFNCWLGHCWQKTFTELYLLVFRPLFCSLACKDYYLVIR